MNSNMQPTFVAAKKAPPPIEQQQHSPSAKGSVIFSFGSNAGTAKASTTGKDFFKSPIIATTTTATTTGQPLFSALDHWAKSDSSVSLLLEKVTSRSLVVPRAKKTRKVRTTWSSTEDAMLKKSVAEQLDLENIDWVTVSQKVDGRNTKQCRDRWHNYLRPGIVKGHWTMNEEELIKDMHQTFGAKWCTMAKLMKNRAENDIKNKWYSMTRKEQRLQSKSSTSNGLLESDPPIDPWSFDYQAFLPMPELTTSMPDSVEDECKNTQDLPHPGQY